MITPEDRAFMKATRKEVVAGRESALQLKYIGPGIEDEFTGEIIGGGPVLLDVMGVVTEMSGDEREVDNGVSIEKGDLQIGIDIDLVGEDYDKYTEVIYKSKTYVIIATDGKGIGDDNRIEIVARLNS